MDDLTVQEATLCADHHVVLHMVCSIFDWQRLNFLLIYCSWSIFYAMLVLARNLDVRPATRNTRNSQVSPTTVPAHTGGQTANHPGCSTVLLSYEGTGQTAACSVSANGPYRNYNIQPGPVFGQLCTEANHLLQ